MLITFGDSWVFGIGAAYSYEHDYTEWDNDKYRKFLFENRHRHSKYSFRKHLSKKMGVSNLNYAEGGSSNQRQFRFASEYFIKNKKVIPKDSIVLWGLTSVYRNELYNSSTNEYENFLLPSSNLQIAKVLTTNYLNEEVEIEKLYYNIELFNSYFKTLGIKNYWFNIFNDHIFPNKIENMLFDNQSLLSVLVNDFAENDSYHKSDWKTNDRKIKKAVELQLVNPVTLHPTQESHIKISDLLYLELQSSASRNT